MIPKLSFIPQALDKWFEKGDNYISVEEIRLKQNIGIFRNTASHFFARSTEKRGVNPRRRNGTVRCMFFPFGANAPVTRKKSVKALRKGRAAIRRAAPSQDIRLRQFAAAFPQKQYAVHKNVCTKALKKALVLFYSDEAERYRSHSLHSKE